ncbi:MAG: hypothetical protein AAF682_15095 [Planctomycetota bacterium]
MQQVECADNCSVEKLHPAPPGQVWAYFESTVPLPPGAEGDRVYGKFSFAWDVCSSPKLGGETSAFWMSSLADELYGDEVEDVFGEGQFPACVQTPFETVGQACAGASGVPGSIYGSGFPTVGESYGVVISGAPWTPTLLGVGTGAIVPRPLDGVGLPGCSLYIEPLTVIPHVTDSGGEAFYAAPAPAVAGAQAYLQGYLLDAGASTLGATTELLQLTTFASCR